MTAVADTAEAPSQAPAARRRPARRDVVAAGVALAIIALSVPLRAQSLGAGLWVDDAQAVGIASRGIGDLPAVLRQDGAPPLYYALLSLWMGAFGRDEAAVCGLALACATLAGVAGLWAGWSLFGRRAGVLCAATVALSPLLSLLAVQARMYTLVALLSLLACACFVHLFVHRRRRFLAPFAVVLALLLYTHYWGLFLAAGLLLAAGWLAERATRRRGIIRDAALAFGGTALLFVFWLPVLLAQVGSTAAPWSAVPQLSDIGLVSTTVLGAGVLAPAVLAAAFGLARIVRRAAPEYHAVFGLGITFLTALGLAWTASQLSPNWAPRYFAVFTGPLALLLALGLARTRVVGAVAFALLVPAWMAAVPRTADFKSNARRALAEVRDLVRPGDLVLSTQPEQVPVLRYYLPAGLRYATPAGPEPEPAVFDWRDGLHRLQSSTLERGLVPQLGRVPPGRRVLLATPILGGTDPSQAPWTALVERHTVQWTQALARDDRFRLVTRSSASDGSVKLSGVEVRLFTRTS